MTVYVPTVVVSTLLVVVTVTVPSTASLAVAPASVYTSPTVRVTSQPLRVITGAVVSAGAETVAEVVIQRLFTSIVPT